MLSLPTRPWPALPLAVGTLMLILTGCGGSSEEASAPAPGLDAAYASCDAAFSVANGVAVRRSADRPSLEIRQAALRQAAAAATQNSTKYAGLRQKWQDYDHAVTRVNEAFSPKYLGKPLPPPDPLEELEHTSAALFQECEALPDLASHIK